MNFDAKIRRQSIEPDDLLIAHVGSMDATARALLNAAAIIADGTFQKFVDDRYAGWESGVGKDILAGRNSLDDLAEYVADKALDPQPKSGRQEYLEGLLNRFC
jgi:xylose isomerase